MPQTLLCLGQCWRWHSREQYRAITSPWQRAQWNLASFPHTEHVLGLPCSAWLPCSIGSHFLLYHVDGVRRLAASGGGDDDDSCVRGAAQLQRLGQTSRAPVIASVFIALALSFPGSSYKTSLRAAIKQLY